MNQQFPEKYSKHDVYYFVNNINPNILLSNKNDNINKKEEVTRKKSKLRVISNAAISNAYSSINFDQFDGEYNGTGKRHSTFMVACKHGYCTKIQFLVDCCQWFIDLTLGGWNRKKKQYCYASDFAIIHNKLYDADERCGVYHTDSSRVSEKLLEWISMIEVEYLDYGMKISFQFLLYKHANF